MGKRRDLIRGFTSEILIRRDTSARGIWEERNELGITHRAAFSSSLLLKAVAEPPRMKFMTYGVTSRPTNHDTQCRGASVGGEDLGVPWLRSGAVAFSLLSLVRSSGVVPGMRVSAAGQPLGETKDQLPGDQSFLVSEQPSLLCMAQGSTARIEKAFPTTAAAS
jgi:hypothetical protein